MANFWKTTELAQLAKVYPSATREELLRLFPRHTIGSIYGTAHELGIRKRTRRRWLEICAAHKPTFKFG